MNEPRIEVLGVYRLPVTEELFREQFDILYGYPMSEPERAQAERQCREQLSSVVLVEASVHNRDQTFDVGRFTQPQEGVPEANWQVAWAEAYLTPDGESLAVERWSKPPQSGDLRAAFFVHFWQPGLPLRTSYGEVECPAVQEMPERLARLVPYEPVD
jgi:hypothetical protein